MKIAIMTDTNSGISVQEGADYGIHVLPMPVIVDGIDYTEGTDITHEQLYAAMESGKAAYTSQPAPGDVTDMWDAILSQGAEEIVYIPMSSELSSTFATASTLAQEYEGRVFVVDNRRISIIQRSSVLDALYLSRRGMRAADIKAQLEKSAFDTSAYICVDTLKYLKKGSRITAAAASLSTAMNLHPVLNLRGGKLDAECVVRGQNRMQKTLIKLMETDIKNRFQFIPAQDISLCTAGTLTSSQDAQAWNARVQKAFPEYEVTYHELSCSIACHVGPGAIAIGMSLVNR
ncbi:MAG TPA: DegV family protein [Clostridiales bacterium]|nr:DegV family protein [Clostridiales bacterium]